MKAPDHIQSGIDALRGATAALRSMGIEILSAAANSHREPEIHVVAPGQLPQTARHVHCVLDRSTHYAVPFMRCLVIWIEPPVVPGAEPARFTHLTERTAEHG